MLKKDLNYLVDEVAGTCLMKHSMDQGLTEQATDALITETLDFRDEMIQRINQPPAESSKGKELKKYYHSLRKEIMEKVDGLFDKIQAGAE